MIIKIIWYHYTSPAISDSRNFRNSEPQVTTLYLVNAVFCPVISIDKVLRQHNLNYTMEGFQFFIPVGWICFGGLNWYPPIVYSTTFCLKSNWKKLFYVQLCLALYTSLCSAVTRGLLHEFCFISIFTQYTILVKHFFLLWSFAFWFASGLFSLFSVVLVGGFVLKIP